MILARCINLDEDALICDFAEYYHIYDYKSLPLQLAGTLVCGLSDNSRTKMKLNGQKVPIDTLLLACIADRLTILVWKDTKDGRRNVNRPKSILSDLINIEETRGQYRSFDSIEDFEEARRKIIEGGC